MTARTRLEQLRTLDLPQVLLVALAGALLLGVIVALTTSATAFGIYNPAWDGASDLSEVAEGTGGDARVALNTTVYERVSPNRTVAVVLSPDTAYAPADRRRLRQFVRSGGTLVIAEDFGPHGNRLLEAVGAETRFDGRLLRDERNAYRSAAMPIAPNVTNSTETRGVDQLTLNYGTVLRTSEADNGTQVLVRSSEFSYLDRNRDGTLNDNETMTRRPVVVREAVSDGAVIAVSDPSLFINTMLERPGNRRFVQNLFGSRAQVVLDYSHLSGRPPLSVALLWLRQTVLLQALVTILGIGGVLVWSRRPAVLDRATGRWRSRESAPTVEHASAVEHGRLDHEALATYLRETHPDWDEDRIERVVRGILARRETREDDD